MACSIIRNKETKEIEKVLAPNGVESKLYADILKIEPDKEVALRQWAKAYTDTFKNSFEEFKKTATEPVEDENGEPLIQHISVPKVDVEYLPNEDEQKQQIGNTVVTKLADELSSNLGVQYEVITPEQARTLTETTKQPWNGEGAFFFGGKVYLLEKGFNKDNVLHEFSHPLVAALQIQNEGLFNKLYTDLTTSKEGQEILQDVSTLYPELKPEDLQFQQEVLVRGLAKEAQNQLDGIEDSKPFKSFLDRLIFGLKQMLRKVFGTKIAIEKLSTDTTLAQLAKMLKSDKFDINSDIITNNDMVDYVRDVSNYTKELDAVEYSAISNSVTRFYSLVSNHINRIRSNKNYNEAAKFLVDETGRGQLQEIKATLENTEIDEKLKDIYDDLTVREKTAKNFVRAVERLDILSNNINLHVKELAKQGDSKEVISKIFYYDLLVRNWGKLLEEMTDRLADGGLSNTSDFSKLVSGIKNTVDQTNRAIAKIYANTVDDVIFTSLMPLAKDIDNYWKGMIDAIDGKPGSKEKIANYQKQWDAMKLSRQKVNDILSGKLGDTNAYSAFLESYTNSPDPIIGGFAMYLKSAYNDVDAVAQRNMNDFMRDMEPLLMVAGYSRSDYSALMKQLVYPETITYVDEDGKLATKQVWSFLHNFKDVLVESNKLNEAYNEAVASGNETLADQALKALRQHRRDYFHQDYVPEYYDREKIYDSDLGKEAYRRKQMLLNQIKEEDAVNYDENFYDEVAQNKVLLWREYSQLASLNDLNGNPKTGDELEIAKIEKEYRKQSRKFFEWVPIKGSFESNLRRVEQDLVDGGLVPGSDEYIEKRDKWIKTNTVLAYTKEFFDERGQVLNDLREVMSRVPEHIRKAIDSSGEMEEMLDLATGFRDQDGQIIGTDITDNTRDKVKTLQQTILNRRNEYAGYSGLTKDEMEELTDLYRTIATRKKLSLSERERMDELMDRKSQLGLDKFTKAEITALYAKLNELQSKEATDYYVDIMNNWLGKMGQPIVTNETATELLHPSKYVSLFKEGGPEFEKWFKENHIPREVYDASIDDYVTYYDRLFIWNRTRPNNPDHFEKITLTDGEVIQGKPNLSYYYRNVKPEFKTQRIVGKTVDNKGHWLPKTLADGAVDDRYINPEYTKLQKNNPAAFAVLEKMTEYHLKFQEELPQESKLYMQIPRFRKPRLEYLRDTKAGEHVSKAKEWGKSIKDTFFKANDDYSQGLNFNSEQLIYTDMFDEEIKKVPIDGLNALDLDQVSMNIGDSMLRYMHSGLRQKKLVELNPFAQALKTAVSHPDNAIKDMSKINKFSFQKLGITSFLNKKGVNVRATAINNLYEREFLGINQKGWFADSPIAQKFIHATMKLNSFAFFAMNILPSAVKNRVAAIVQLNIEAAGGKWVNPISYAKGKPMAWKMLAELNAQQYTTKNRSLNVQLMQIFDPSQQIFERALGSGEGSKLGGQFGRSFATDAASLTWLMSPRKFLELEATLEMFTGMLYHVKVEQTINGQTKEINYANAWEIRNGQIELKPGIDKKWAPGGEKFNEFKNQSHEVSNRLQGTYARMDQPEAQRYAAFRIISFLKRFFTSMLMNRFAASRPSAALGTVTTGYYTSTLKVARDFYRYGINNYQLLSKEEKQNMLKVVADISFQIGMLMLLSSVFGYDDDDKDRFAKMKKRSGALNDEDFNLGGWLANHAVVATLATLAETEQFTSPNQVKNMARNILTPSALYGITLEKPMNVLTHTYGALRNDPSAFYKKDAGPYSFQKQGEAKVYNDLAKMFGITGSQVDPVKALKGQEFQRR